MNILLLHGIFDTARIFTRLQGELEAAGHVCHAPSLQPADARHGIHHLSDSVKSYVSGRISNEEPFLIVGFSMGGIGARQYMQVLDGAARVPAFFSISCPHAGSLSSYLYFGQGARDMRPGSALLANLRETECVLGDMPIHNYWTSLDLVVIPATHCRWPRADREMDVHALLHRSMPSHPRVRQDIVLHANALDAGLTKQAG